LVLNAADVPPSRVDEPDEVSTPVAADDHHGAVSGLAMVSDYGPTRAWAGCGRGRTDPSDTYASSNDCGREHCGSSTHGQTFRLMRWVAPQGI
jgi:hypothetical protein